MAKPRKEEEESEINFSMLSDYIMKKKICILLISLSLLVLAHSVLAQVPSAKPLEVVYPLVPGEQGQLFSPEIVGIWLPNYVNYIFRFAVVFSGIVIFGTFVYSGINYLISGLSPTRLAEAKSGMTNSILAAIILFSAVLIFNTINPQLTILKLPEVSLLAGIATPGVYVCTYNVETELRNIKEPGTYATYTFSTLQELLDAYMLLGDIPTDIEAQNKKTDRQIAATKVLKKIMNLDQNNRCLRANSSGDFPESIGPDDSMFIIPRVVIEPTGKADSPTKRVAIYEYGIILHEKPGQKGWCQLYPEPQNGSLYYKPDKLKPGSVVRSFTLFKKPEVEPPADAWGVVLYHCLYYNTNPASFCPESLLSSGQNPTPIQDPTGRSFKPEGNMDIALFSPDDLLEYPHNKKWGTRSVLIRPEGSYFAVFFGDENFSGNCEIIKSDHSVLLNAVNEGCSTLGLGCGVIGLFTSIFTLSFRQEWETCVPCLQSMYVVKGEVL